MITLLKNGAYLLRGQEIIEDNADAEAIIKSKTGRDVDKEAAAKNTISYGILAEHNTSGNTKCHRHISCHLSNQVTEGT